LTGNFTDPNLPRGYVPFNIQMLNGQLYVTYTKQKPGAMDDPGPGNGFVDVYTLNGNLVRRLISNGALNSPWGLAIAASGFGTPPAETCWWVTSETGRLVCLRHLARQSGRCLMLGIIRL